MAYAYSKKVNDLYAKLVDSGRMRPLTLGNIQYLVSLEQNGIFEKFISVLRRECSNLKGSRGEETVLVSLLVLCCNAYDFNEATVQVYNNGSINGFWRAIGRSRANFFMLNPTANKRRRDGPGIVACALLTRPSRSISTSSSSDRVALEATPKSMMGKDLGCLEVDSNCTPALASSFCVFRDYASMITSVCGYTGGQTSVSTLVFTPTDVVSCQLS
jgi:hypothetical protein